MAVKTRPTKREQILASVRKRKSGRVQVTVIAEECDASVSYTRMVLRDADFAPSGTATADKPEWHSPAARKAEAAAQKVKRKRS